MIRSKLLITEDREQNEEGCDDIQETAPSLEQVAGVEESGMDVPVVEKITDTSRDHSE